MIEMIQIEEESEVPKYRQIEHSIEHALAQGLVKKNDQLPSINKVCELFGLSRDTVVKAYNLLKERGVIASTPGKGFFLTGQYLAPKKKIFVLFNELNAYKEVLHKSLLSALDPEIEVDTFFHNHNLEVFEYLIDKSLGNYTDYVIMPTFNEQEARVLQAVQKIPPKKLFLIDRHLEGIKGGSIYQDFRNDVIQGLEQLKPSILHYESISILYDATYLHPYASVEGIQHFFNNHLVMIENPSTLFELKQNRLYFTFKDTDLVKLVKLGNHLDFTPGKEYGLISYNDSPMKEIIHQGITVISTDFEAMGKKIANLIQSGFQEQSPNPLKVIQRNSIK